MEAIATGKELYGLPHLGAEYVSGSKGGRRNYRRTGEVCAVCDSQRATNVHHLIGTGMGGRQGSVGIDVDRAHCEGYDGCHGRFEDGSYTVEWVWHDEVCETLWSKGWMLGHGYAPHSPALFEFGYYRIRCRGDVVKEVRHGC